MSKMSLWKRVGGWLRPASNDTDMLVDEDGLLIDPNSQEAVMAKKPNKEQQLAAMEESFRRLVEVLESLNDNVVKQNDKSTELNQNLQTLPKIVEQIPQASAAQKEVIEKLADELRNQSSRSQQLTEIIKDLPDLTQQQIDRLGDINQQLESSVESDNKLVKSFDQIDQSMSEMLNHSQGQSMSLVNLGEQIQKSDYHLIETLTRQNRKMMWIFALMAILISGAVVAMLILA